jgi:hypothetical protein
MKHIKKIQPKKKVAVQSKELPKEQPTKLACIPKRIM